MLDTYKNKFYSNVNLPENASDCMPWLAAKTKAGYGRITIYGKEIYAHRFSYQIHISSIPEGLLVCHFCDNRACVNPSHLFLGTPKDNFQDCFNKKRFKSIPENKKNKKLTARQRKNIINKLLDGESMRSIATYYKVSKGAIDDIKRRHLNENQRSLVLEKSMEKSQWKKIKPYMEKDILDRISKGERIIKIAKEYNVNISTIYNIKYKYE